MLSIKRWSLIRAWLIAKWRGLVVWAGLVLIATVCVILLMGYALSQETPIWWRQVEDDEKTRQLAVTVENSVVSELHRVRQGDGQDGGKNVSELWGVSLTSAAANAWLNARFTRWIKNQGLGTWPEALSELQVDFDDDEVRIGVRARVESKEHILSVALAPEIDGDGKLWMRARWIAIGRLKVPARWAIQSVGGGDVASGGVGGGMGGGVGGGVKTYLPGDVLKLEMTKQVVDALLGDQPALDEPILKLGDGRVIRLMGFRWQEGRLEVLCQTEWGQE